MPFGPYADFDACVTDQSQKHDTESAKRICGAMQAQLGGSLDSNYVSHELDKNGHLILKYFFADTSMTELPTANGHFSLDGAAMRQADSEVFGLPFTILPSKDLSVFGDWHAWHPDLGNATLEQHIQFARDYSPGSIVGITPMGANTDVTSNGGRFVFVDITDEAAKSAYISNPALIPKKVSPGFLNMESPNRDGIKSVKWAHLAAVPQGAYGAKARLYGSCIGPKDKCMTKLQGASAANYCAVGASEALYSSSLSSTPNILDKMSVNPTLDNNANANSSNNNTTNAPVQETKPTQAPVTAPVQNVPTTEQKPVEEQKKPLLRLKGAQPQSSIDPSKFEEMQARLDEIEKLNAFNERTKAIRNLIDTRLFVINGKYNQKEHEAAITDAANSQWSDEQIAKYYSGLLRIKEFEESQQPQKGNRQINPLGGSYVSPSGVPEGGSIAEIDAETFRTQKVKGLFNMFGVSV